MRLILVFSSGCLSTTLIYWMLEPLLSLAAFFVGFSIGAIITGGVVVAGSLGNR